MIETYSDLLRKSSVIFGHLRKCSQIFGFVSLAFGQSLENLRKSSESVRKSSENRRKRRYILSEFYITKNRYANSWENLLSPRVHVIFSIYFQPIWWFHCCRCVVFYSGTREKLTASWLDDTVPSILPGNSTTTTCRNMTWVM